MKIKRKPFTLIEILVCLTLLAIAWSLLVYKGGKLLQERRFSSSCEKLTSEIFVTKSLALTYQIDIDLVLEQRNGKFYFSRKTDFAESNIRSLFQSEIVFPELVFGKEDEKKELHFYGNGWIEGDDKITLSMASHLKKQYSVEIKHSFRKAV